MRITYSYTYYEESMLATFISRLGGLCNALGVLWVIATIAQVGDKILNKAKHDNSYLAMSAIATIAFLVVGWLLKRVARNIALKEINKRLELSCDEVEKLVEKKPRFKKWFLENHPDYREAHKDEIMANNSKKQVSKKRKIMAACVTILIGAVIVFFVFKMSEGHESVVTNEDKYQCYVELNNDIVRCYEFSINLYLKDKGVNEQIKQSQDPNKLQMNPINDYNYKILEKVKKVSKEKPKMDVDDDANKLAEATEKVYNLIGEIHYVYGGKEYIKKTDKSKEELHKEFLLTIQDYNIIYRNFSMKMDKVDIEIMTKDLEKFKKNNDMDSYHTLNAMLKAEKVYEYFISNKITNENLFNINLDDYSKILQEYNTAYDDFKKQNVKGSTIHTKSYIEEMTEYHSLVNNVVNMVKQKNFYPGKATKPNGKVTSSKEEDIQDRLYFYIDRLISSYNSIQTFKK